MENETFWRVGGWNVLRTLLGMAQSCAWRLTIPFCPKHHQNGPKWTKVEEPGNAHGYMDSHNPSPAHLIAVAMLPVPFPAPHCRRYATRSFPYTHPQWDPPFSDKLALTLNNPKPLSSPPLTLRRPSPFKTLRPASLILAAVFYAFVHSQTCISDPARPASWVEKDSHIHVTLNVF